MPGVLSNIGDLQTLVLTYASQYPTFSASDVVIAFNLKLRYGANANKRVHDAITRLVRRGLLDRVAWGLYRLKVELPLVPARKSWVPVGGSGFSGFGFGGGVCSGVLRVHVRGSDFPTVFGRALLASLACAGFVRVLEWVGCGVYGRGFVRRLRRWFLRRFSVWGVVAGCHGRFGERGFEGLRPLRYLGWRYFNEVGVDFFGDFPAKGMYVKIYFKELGASRRIDEYFNEVRDAALRPPSRGAGASRAPEQLPRQPPRWAPPCEPSSFSPRSPGKL